MKKKAGFTLLEILIAATIVGALAVLATTSYRSTVAETHIQAAKIRTEQLANAVQRFQVDYGASKLAKGVEFSRLESVGACNPTATETTASKLIKCGYLQNDGGWNDIYVQYYVCNNAKTADTPCYNSGVSSPLACMRGRSALNKLPEKYKKSDYSYCVSADSRAETGS